MPCLFGAAALLPPALFEGLAGDLGRYSMPTWLSIAYLGFFGTCLGFVWYYEGIRQIGPSKAAVFINFVPISAVMVSRILRPEGHFTFTLLGKDTMYELKYSYRNAKRKLGINIPLHFHTFAEKNYVYDCLQKNGFINIHINRSIKKEYHPDVRSIFSTLKATGAQNASRETPRGLGRRNLFNWLSAFYEAVFKTPSGLSPGFKNWR